MENRKRRAIKSVVSILLSFAILCTLGWDGEAHAQAYPTRSINMLISFAPGAATDIGARLIAKEAEKFLGQEIVPVNKPGGGGAVTAGILASSKADGYTIMGNVSSALTNAPHLESVNYDPIKDFSYIHQYGLLISVYIVRADSPYKSFKEFIDFGGKNPGKLSIGTPGVGTSPHLAMELLKLKEKIDIATIPFAGSAPALTSLLGGHISSVGTSTPSAIPHLKAGKMRALATTGETRTEAMPDVPTLKELGFPYGVFIEVFFIAAPKGTPPAVVAKLEEAFRKASEVVEYKTKMKGLYMYPEQPLRADKLKEFVEQEHARCGEIIKGAKLGK